MRKIEIPDISQEEIYNSFNELNYKEIILEKDEEYEDILNNVDELYNSELEFIKKHREYLGYMKKIYSERFSNKNYKNSYKYYIGIRSSETICPYCNYFTRQVRQLDHFLPKSKFPSLAITVKNLVPICKECNELKGDYFPENGSKQLIHPYYGIDSDDIYEFLKCSIIESDNIGFEFYIKKLDRWDDTIFYNVKFHFEKLKIDELYLADFQADFDVFLVELRMCYEEFRNKDIVNKLFKIKVKSYLDSKNMPWRYVGFNSLLENEWFLNTYLKKISNND